MNDEPQIYNKQLIWYFKSDQQEENYLICGSKLIQQMIFQINDWDILLKLKHNYNLSVNF